MEEKESGLARRVEELRKEVRQRDIAELAENTGAVYEDGGLRLTVWGSLVEISEQDFVARYADSGQACDEVTQAMLAYYLYTSNGTPISNELISFSELPDGQFYASAFQGYSGNKLAQRFGDDVEAFKSAAQRTGGRALSIGDASFVFQALPRVPVAVVCWLGDEDFPSSYRILFDSSADQHLPTDACAILGSMLTGRIIRSA